MKHNKGFATVLIALIVAGVLAAGGGIYYLGKSSNDKEIKFEEKNIPIQNTEEKNSVLPDSFSMEMYGDYDSSGADRTYQGELTFKNNEVISGSQVYIVGEGRNCQDNCDRKTECKVLNQQWVDKTTGGECTIDAYSTPLNKEGIIQKINEGKLIQTEDLSKCGHAVTCYQIKNARFNNDKVEDNSITKIFQSITKKEVKKIELSSTDNDKSFAVVKGQIITITVRNPGDGGFEFDDPKYNNSILKFKNKTHVNAMIDPSVGVSRPGDFGKDVFEFEAINVGESKINITASQQWDGGTKQTEMFSVTIMVK